MALDFAKLGRTEFAEQIDGRQRVGASGIHGRFTACCDTAEALPKGDHSALCRHIQQRPTPAFT
jgi:hypothetical protein